MKSLNISSQQIILNIAFYPLKKKKNKKLHSLTLLSKVAGVRFCELFLTAFNFFPQNVRQNLK